MSQMIEDISNIRQEQHRLQDWPKTTRKMEIELSSLRQDTLESRTRLTTVEDALRSSISNNLTIAVLHIVSYARRYKSTSKSTLPAKPTQPTPLPQLPRTPTPTPSTPRQNPNVPLYGTNHPKLQPSMKTLPIPGHPLPPTHPLLHQTAATQQAGSKTTRFPSGLPPTPQATGQGPITPPQNRDYTPL